MVCSHGAIKIWKHDQGVKLPSVLKELKKRGFIMKDRQGKYNYNKDSNQQVLNV